MSIVGPSGCGEEHAADDRRRPPRLQQRSGSGGRRGCRRPPGRNLGSSSSTTPCWTGGPRSRTSCFRSNPRQDKRCTIGPGDCTSCAPSGSRLLIRPATRVVGRHEATLALCRSLIHDPPLLLMDEPSGALDALTRDQMMPRPPGDLAGTPQDRPVRHPQHLGGDLPVGLRGGDPAPDRAGSTASSTSTYPGRGLSTPRAALSSTSTSRLSGASSNDAGSFTTQPTSRGSRSDHDLCRYTTTHAGSGDPAGAGASPGSGCPPWAICS